MRALTFFVAKVLKLLFMPLAMKRRVAFLSSFSDDMGENVACIARELNDMSIDFVTNCKRIKPGFAGSLAYAFAVMRDVYLLSTCKIVLLEGNCVALAGMGKHRCTVLQLWHASGAFKKFGNDTQRKYEVSGIDYVLVSAQSARQIYAGALGVNAPHVLGVGTPRTDEAVKNLSEFTDRARKKLGVSGKTVLYVPTFRGRGVTDVKNPLMDVQKLADALGEHTLILRKHPAMKHMAVPRGAVDGGDFELMDVLAAADVLITDYSSVIFEYAVFDRPMVFYAQDLGEYTRERGFYFDYENFVPGEIVTDEISAAHAILRDDFAGKREQFKSEWLELCDGKSTQRTVQIILNLLDDKELNEKDSK